MPHVALAHRQGRGCSAVCPAKVPTPWARILGSKDAMEPTPFPCHPPLGLLGHGMWLYETSENPRRLPLGTWKLHTAGVARTQNLPLHWMEGKEQRSWWLLPQCFITTSLISSPSLARGSLIIPSPSRVPAAFLIKTEARRLGGPSSLPTFCNRAALEVSQAV